MCLHPTGIDAYRYNGFIRVEFTPNGEDEHQICINNTNSTSWGDIYDEVTELPIEGAEFTVFNAPGGVTITATSNAEGIVLLTILGFAPNKTVLLESDLTVDGYKPESGVQEVTAGNFYSIDAGMEPIS